MRTYLSIIKSLFLILIFINSVFLLAEVPRRPFLFKDDRGEIAQARARGEKEVLLVIASMPSKNSKVVRLINELSGTVQFQDDELDYIRAVMPINSVQSLVGKKDRSMEFVFMSQELGLIKE